MQPPALVLPAMVRKMVTTFLFNHPAEDVAAEAVSLEVKRHITLESIMRVESNDFDVNMPDNILQVFQLCLDLLP